MVALVEAEGEVFLGVNVENASFPLSQCAERNAVAAMVLAGKRRLERVHVYSPKGPIPVRGVPAGPPGVRGARGGGGSPRAEEEVRTTLGALLPMAFRL